MKSTLCRWRFQNLVVAQSDLFHVVAKQNLEETGGGYFAISISRIRCEETEHGECSDRRNIHLAVESSKYLGAKIKRATAGQDCIGTTNDEVSSPFLLSDRVTYRYLTWYFYVSRLPRRTTLTGSVVALAEGTAESVGGSRYFKRTREVCYSVRLYRVIGDRWITKRNVPGFFVSKQKLRLKRSWYDRPRGYLWVNRSNCNTMYFPMRHRREKLICSHCINFNSIKLNHSISK